MDRLRAVCGFGRRRGAKRGDPRHDPCQQIGGRLDARQNLDANTIGAKLLVCGACLAGVVEEQSETLGLRSGQVAVHAGGDQVEFVVGQHFRGITLRVGPALASFVLGCQEDAEFKSGSM
jgi:hypothetical protein